MSKMISISTVHGPSINMKVNLDRTIDSYQEEFAKVTGILAIDQRIIYAGKQLDNYKTFADCNIQDNSKIYIVERLPSSKQRNLYEMEQDLKFKPAIFGGSEFESIQFETLKLLHKNEEIKFVHEQLKNEILKQKLETYNLKKENKDLEAQLKKLFQEYE